MIDLLTLTEGMEVDCIEGECGRVSRALVDSGDKLAHIAVENETDGGRLVPFERISSVGTAIRLDCTIAEFASFETAEVQQIENDVYAAARGMEKMRPVLRHNVPLGETEVYEHEDVRADNGILGRLHGLVIDKRSGKLEQLLVTAGHLFGKHEMTVPASFVSGFAMQEVKLRGSKHDIRHASVT